MFWWGVTNSTVWSWRRVLGVGGRAGTPGSQRLIQAAAELGAEAMASRSAPENSRAAKRKNAIELDLGRPLVTGYHGPQWTGEDLQLLGTRPDADVARLVKEKAGTPAAKQGQKVLDNILGGFRINDREFRGEGTFATVRARLDTAIEKVR